MIKNCEQCGKEFKVTTKKKKYCSLECYKKSRKKYIIGKKFGRLTVIKKMENNKYLCKCDCGNETVVYASNLITGHTKSCGCNKKYSGKNLKTHGLSKLRLYKIWKDIKERCYKSNNKAYKNYGGRGITICEEWKNDFKAFHDWAFANGYDENAEYGKCTIDRINSNGNYEPNNCRWIDIKEQARNKRNNALFTYNNETYCIAEWAEKFKIRYNTLWARLNIYKWDIKKALITKQG